MIYTAIFFTFLATCFLSFKIFQKIYNEMEEKHRSEIEAAIQTAIAQKEGEKGIFYQDIIKIQMSEKEKAFDFALKIANILADKFDINPYPTQTNALEMPINAVNTPYIDTPLEIDNAGEERIIFRKGSKEKLSNDKYTININDSSCKLEIEGKQIYTKFPGPGEPNIKVIDGLYLGRCKNDNRVFATVEPATNFCTDNCKQKYHAKK